MLLACAASGMGRPSGSGMGRQLRWRSPFWRLGDSLSLAAAPACMTLTVPACAAAEGHMLQLRKEESTRPANRPGPPFSAGASHCLVRRRSRLGLLCCLLWRWVQCSLLQACRGSPCPIGVPPTPAPLPLRCLFVACMPHALPAAGSRDHDKFQMSRMHLPRDRKGSR